MADEVHGEVREDRGRDAESDARRRAALAQIRQYGDPALRMRAHEVKEFDDDLRRLVERMKALMVDANGIGLAATQVGVLRRVFVFQAPDGDDVRALVNPSIAAAGDETDSDEEGCLSLQGILVPVERPAAVVVEARDEAGADVRLELDGMGARVVQHELDHLDGVLIIDRTTREARREAMAVLRPRSVLV